MNKKPPSRESDQFVLRFHKNGQRTALKFRANENNRSLNSELLFLIEKGIEAVDGKKMVAQ